AAGCSACAAPSSAPPVAARSGRAAAWASRSTRWRWWPRSQRPSRRLPTATPRALIFPVAASWLRPRRSRTTGAACLTTSARAASAVRTAGAAKASRWGPGPTTPCSGRSWWRRRSAGAGTGARAASA
ncbi:unnamed protein product, partial [Prorocentrum cordatum]